MTNDTRVETLSAKVTGTSPLAARLRAQLGGPRQPSEGQPSGLTLAIDQLAAAHGGRADDAREIAVARLRQHLGLPRTPSGLEQSMDRLIAKRLGRFGPVAATEIRSGLETSMDRLIAQHGGRVIARQADRSAG